MKAYGNTFILDFGFVCGILSRHARVVTMKALICALALAGAIQADTLISVFTTQTPAVVSVNDPNAVELGMRFAASQTGHARAIRFYKSEQNTGTHIGRLWDNTGNLLDSCIFANETASGWQTCNLGGNVQLGANRFFVVSYHTTTGFYSADSHGLAASIANGPIHSLPDSARTPNGVYLYGAGGFPINTFQSTNYWVDLVEAFTCNCPTPTPTPTVTPTPTPTVTPTPTPTPTAGGPTFFISASGNDANTGLTHATAWQHAPGMATCSANCAAHVPQPGENYVFRGGDTWHFTGFGARDASNSDGLPWLWNWSGAASSPIYVGVDVGWFGGSVWHRPVLTGDNPPSMAVVSACTGTTGRDNWLFNFGSFVTLDDFEWTGMCTDGPATINQYLINGDNDTDILIENNYFHGFTHTSGATGSSIAVLGTSHGANGVRSIFRWNVIDFSDSDSRSIQGLYGNCYDFHQNVVRYNDNGVICNNMHTLWGNLFEFIDEPIYSAEHGNTFEFNGEWAGDNTVYNNVIRHIGTLSDQAIGVNLWMHPSHIDYVFNNVVYDIHIPGNYWVLTGDGEGWTVNADNNTLVLGQNAGSAAAPGPGNTVNATNDHCIGSEFGSCWAGTGITNVTTPLVQTTADAAAAGYTAGNQYGSGLASGPTIGMGTNLTGACSLAGAALCAQSGTVQYDAVNHVVIVPTATTPRPVTGTWDIGAY